jgi:hypothetical protein
MNWCPQYELKYDKRFRNGSKTFLKRLGVSNDFSVFSIYQALRRVSLSPLILRSLGLQKKL